MNVNIFDLVKEIFLEHKIAKSFVTIGIILVIVQRFTNQSSYSTLILTIGLGFISVGTLLITLGIFWQVIRICWFRYKYPITSVARKYYLLRFDGPVFLYDFCKKEKRLVASWQTALDLRYLHHWVEMRDIKVTDDFQVSLGHEVNINNLEYKFGKVILTRGIPGS